MTTFNQNLPKSILTLLQLSEAAKLKGEHKEAISFAEKALGKDPTCVEALEEIADNYLALDQLKKATEAATFALELNKDSYTSLYILGFAESRQNNFIAATKFLEKANQLKPNNSEILRSLGWACFMSEKQLKGIVILERALNLNQDDVMILCDLGICYIKTHKTEKALDLFYRAMEINPEDERIKECIKIAEEVQKLPEKK
jgi:tetratricopeptide (TPR) repeat protein